LLLGPGESGKSTLFRQLTCLYGAGFTEQDRKKYTPIIRTNTVLAMKTLCTQSDKLENCSVGPTCLKAKSAIDRLRLEEMGLTPELVGHMEALWRDEGIQHTYSQRSKFQLMDSTSYFFERLREVAAEEYIPSEDDLMRVRVRTTGIVETTFVIRGNEFTMVDVGGQRNERKKWIHCFDRVTAVLFVTAISEYDQMLYEEETQPRMMESLNLFEECCNSRWFSQASIILMLNKRDLFAEKITQVPLNQFFVDYKGANTYEEAANYIFEEFKSRNRSTNKIYSHLTCATDRNNVQRVFLAIKDIVLRNDLKKHNLI